MSYRPTTAGVVAALRIAAKDLRQSLRDRSFFVLGILAPLGIIGVFTFTIGDAFNGTLNPVIRIADETGVVGDGIVVGMSEAGFENVATVESADEARRQVGDGEADAAIIFPAALATTLSDPAPAPAGDPVDTVVVVSPDSDLSAQIATAVARSTTASFRTRQAIGIALATAGVDPSGAASGDFAPPVTIVDRTAGTRTLGDATYFAVAMAAFFVFFVTQNAVATIHRERRDETLARILVAPVPRWSVLAGKAVAAVATGMIAYTVLWLASVLLFGADWGPAPGVILIGLVSMVAAVGLALVIISLTRTEDGANQLTGTTTTALAFIGGAFFPLSRTGVLGALSALSPFRWIVEAVGENAGVGTMGDVARLAVIIALFGLVPGAVAIGRSQRLLEGA